MGEGGAWLLDYCSGGFKLRGSSNLVLVNPSLGRSKQQAVLIKTAFTTVLNDA
jgi:hypothetical protein